MGAVEAHDCKAAVLGEAAAVSILKDLPYIIEVYYMF
jgi:hypothetical protein